MTQKIQTLCNEFNHHFEKSGRAYPKEKEAEIWLKNYKNTNPKFRMHNVEEEKFRKSAASVTSDLSELSELDQGKFYHQLFKTTPYYYMGHEAIYHFKQKQKKRHPGLIRFWPQLKQWVSRIDNWAHADMLASLYCDMLTEDPKKVLPELEKWSKTKNPWKNRMAIVSLLYYYNPKRYKPPFAKIKAMVAPHLEVDHYYLQKAIGWNLREVSTAYPSEYKKFMEMHLTKISSTAFSTAVEKCDKELKEKWKLKRKEFRKKKTK